MGCDGWLLLAITVKPGVHRGGHGIRIEIAVEELVDGLGCGLRIGNYFGVVQRENSCIGPLLEPLADRT